MTATAREPVTGVGSDGVSDALLDVTFSVPAPPRLYVDRPRLSACLDRGAALPLVLVSAPAGSGKTALVASWVSRQASDSVAWVTFESGDEGPERFWPLVVECLRRRGVPIPYGPEEGSQTTRRRMLTGLAAALAGLDDPLTLVLDGFEIAAGSLARDLEFLLSHSGRRLRLMLLTRVDPALLLHRYRLAETIAEVRMSDLAFSEEETAKLLSVSGVRLSRASVRVLCARTRGWAVGLRFAAMMLGASGDPEGAVNQLAGDKGNISEYLMAEILQTQPADVRDLLLRTSVVDVLQPGLIEELGGQSAGRRLASLARGNVLVEEVAGKPGWYRYHPFLREMLRAELGYASPRRLRRIQRRAATWFARQGVVDEAVALAATSRAWTDAAEYTVQGLAFGRLVVGDDTGGLVHALRPVPGNTGDRAVAVVRAALALADHDYRLSAAELQKVRGHGDGEVPVADPALDLAVEVIDTVRASAVGDERALELADLAARLLAEQPPLGPAAHSDLTALIQSSRGVAQLRNGEIAEAGRSLTAAAKAADEAGSKHLSVFCLAYLGLVAALQGELQSARDLASRSAVLAEEIGVRPEGRLPAAEIALAWVSVEQSDARAARAHLDAAMRNIGADPVTEVLCALVRAHLLRTVADLPGAESAIGDVIDVVPAGADWLTDRLGVEAARLRVAQGDADGALRLLDGLDDPEGLAAWLVRGHAAVARADWRALGEAVSAFVGRDEDPPLPAKVDGYLLEVAHELQRGQPRRARVALTRALRLAVSQRARRPFREAPAAVREMLQADDGLVDQNPWLGAAIGRQRRTGAPSPSRSDAAAPGDRIIEPLTAKEQEVLVHLSELLSTDEIATAMFVSVNTVRTHVRSILRKLAVSRRNEAVRRAKALSLIGV